MKNHLFAAGMLIGSAVLAGCSADVIKEEAGTGETEATEENQTAELKQELAESQEEEEKLAQELEGRNAAFSQLEAEYAALGDADAKQKETEDGLYEKISRLEQEKTLFLQAHKQAALFFQALAADDAKKITELVDENVEVQGNELFIVKKDRSLEKVSFSGFQEGDGENSASTVRFDIAGYALSEGMMKMEYLQVLDTAETYPVTVYFIKKEDGSLKITDMEIES